MRKFWIPAVAAIAVAGTVACGGSAKAETIRWNGAEHNVSELRTMIHTAMATPSDAAAYLSICKQLRGLSDAQAGRYITTVFLGGAKDTPAASYEVVAQIIKERC